MGCDEATSERPAEPLLLRSCVSTASMKVKHMKKLTFTKGHFPRLAECAHFHYENTTEDRKGGSDIASLPCPACRVGVGWGGGCRAQTVGGDGRGGSSLFTMREPLQPPPDSLLLRSGRRLRATSLVAGLHDTSLVVVVVVVVTWPQHQDQSVCSHLSFTEDQGEGQKAGLDSKELLFLVQISCQGRSWLVKRSFEDFRVLDKHLHLCIFDRHFSQLAELPRHEILKGTDECVAKMLATYLSQFSALADNNINCGPVLTWMEVGFFPSDCVELISEKIPPTKLRQRGILKERVFGCDLGEYLHNSGYEGMGMDVDGQETEAVSASTDEERLAKIHNVIQQLPPPHYRSVSGSPAHPGGRLWNTYS
ncbi:hypothetical protein CRUP_001884 [Coryphaenoides rupestris]|nr:hypothetical protein CRUP_001884 [Coryphaenoides rupestris]